MSADVSIANFLRIVQQDLDGAKRGIGRQHIGDDIRVTATEGDGRSFGR